MKIEVKGSKDNVYVVDTELMTCTCPRFQFHCKNFEVNDPQRVCKHMGSVLAEHSTEKSVVSPDADGKVRYPREKFEPYIAIIDHITDTFSPFISKQLVCGSWRREAERVSDLDVLLVMKDVQSFRELQNYVESKYSPTVRWKGDAKATYVFDEFCQVDFKIVSTEHWPFATMHYTGSKNENIRLRRVAKSMGYSMSEYGFCDILHPDEGYDQFGLKTEEDVYKFLNQTYKHPKDR